MSVASAALPVAAPASRGLTWGLWAFIWLLPFHIVAIAALFGILGLPLLVVRGIAAWKEATVVLLVALTLLGALRGRTARSPVQATDLAVTALCALACVYLLGATVWFSSDLPAIVQLYGWRDAVFFTLLYFVGRATPQVALNPRYLRALFAVGVITSAIAILERLFVTPQMLVVLGAARYMQEFLGLAVGTRSNPYGLPDNYWTSIGDHVVRRVGSTYLSSLYFAVPFLLILPAATLWLFSRERRRPTLGWVGYALLWTGLLLTVTRTTIITCAIQVLALAGARRRWGMAVSAGLAGLVGFALALVAVPGLATFVWDTLTWQTGSSVGHLADWSTGAQSLVEHPLGLGLGAGGLTSARFGLTSAAADSQYFKYSAELGLAGLALYLAILVGIAAAGVKAFRTAPGEPARNCGALVAVATLGLALNGTTTVPLGDPFFGYIFFWLAGAVVTVAGRASRAGKGGP